MLSDYRLFFREYVRHFHSTGSISPSSRWLAGALARYVTSDGRAKRILEVGPGTGAVTGAIVRRLGPDDVLDLVELNEQFVGRLRKRFETEPKLKAVADRVRILHQAVEELPHDQPYDLIISGLPLNNFSVELVETILTALKRLLVPGGTLSFFEYVAVRKARAVVSRGAGRERLRGIDKILKRTLQGREIKRDLVLPNIPPAWVHHVQLNGPATT